MYTWLKGNVKIEFREFSSDYFETDEREVTLYIDSCNCNTKHDEICEYMRKVAIQDLFEAYIQNADDYYINNTTGTFCYEDEETTVLKIDKIIICNYKYGIYDSHDDEFTLKEWQDEILD